MNNLSGMHFYAKRAGWRWQVWKAYQDGKADANGATEWLACSVRYWRWLNAERAALAMLTAFNDGVWIAEGRRVAPAGWSL